MTSEKIKAVTGMHDILPEETRLWRKLEETSRAVFETHGYAEIRVPLLEDTALFTRGIGTETQVVQKEMYTFTDKGGDSVTLRPEGTAGVVRAYVEHALHAQEELVKLHYMGPMFRYERPQKGRLRQFHQIGVEIFGTNSPLADAEVITVADRIARGVGLGGYTLFVNTLGLNSERAPYLEKLTAFLAARRDALCEDCRRRMDKNPLRAFDCKNAACQKILSDAPLLADFLGDESRKHFDALQNALARAGVAFTVNPRIVRGLDYYEKTAFEFVSDRLGSQSTFVGGGRYDRLVEDLGGPAVPGVGFGLGCERVILLMREAEKDAPAPNALNGVYFAGLNEACLAKARDLMQAARDAGLRAEAGFEAKSFKSQLRRANKLGFRLAAIVGDDELAERKATLKDLASGEQKQVAFEELVAACRAAGGTSQRPTSA